MLREFGGCACNIAYNLICSVAEPLIMATVVDFSGLRTTSGKNGLSQAHIRPIPAAIRGPAFITTDLDDNQITAFRFPAR